MNPRDIVDPPPTIEPASSSSSESGEEELHAGLRPTSSTAGTGPSNPNQVGTRNLSAENETEEQRLPENFEELTPPSGTNIALRPENQVAAQSDPSDLVSAQLTNLVSLVHQLVNRQERHEQQLQNLSQSINPPRMRTGTRPSRVTFREGVTDGNLPRTRLNFNKNGNLIPDLRPIETPLNNGIPPMFTPPTCTSAMGSNLASSSSRNLRYPTNPSERELPSPPPFLPNGGPPQTIWMGFSASASHSQVTPTPNQGTSGNQRNSKFRPYDVSKYCSHHEKAGHSTEECAEVMKQLAKKFAAGELKSVELNKPPFKRAQSQNKSNQHEEFKKRERTQEEETNSPPPNPAKSKKRNNHLLRDYSAPRHCRRSRKNC